VLAPASAASLARALERYARRNIPERNKAYGEFMYHAELLRKGHLEIHQQDLRHLTPKFQSIVADLRARAVEP
jgi:hypothetical protein